MYICMHMSVCIYIGIKLKSKWVRYLRLSVTKPMETSADRGCLEKVIFSVRRVGVDKKKSARKVEGRNRVRRSHV